MNRKLFKKGLAIGLMASLLLHSAPVFSDAAENRIGQLITVILKNGNQISGKVIAWDDSQAKILTENGEIEFSPTDIVLIRAADSAPLPTTTPETNTRKIAWQKDLNQAENSRTAFYLLGIAGVVVGTSVFIKGQDENQSARDVPGCSVSGNTVFCPDAQTTQEAQDKIDSGEQKMTTGLVVLLVGSLCVLGGAMQQKKVNEIKAKGKRNGFALEINGPSDKRVALAYRYQF